MPDITIASKPYFRVYNGDISAGLSATAANPCTGWSTSSGTIYGWNNGAGVGAGTQLAAFALNAIDGVTSATNNTSLVTGSPKPAKGLSFANTVALEPFGGNFNKGSCPADYYATSTGATAKTGSGTPPTDRITSLNTGKYTYPGGIHLNGGNVSSNSKVTIYVDGDAYIDSDIQYPSNTWGDLKTMESFYVIVKGNIYISNLVNNLDGVYVAQPKADGTGGTIYTCYNNSGITDQAFIVSRCGAQGGGKPLLVNGALLAQSLRLLRSYGTQSSSSQTENTNPSTSTSAEIINYSPELWLTAPAPFDSGSTQTNFDAISTQAPIL